MRPCGDIPHKLYWQVVKNDADVLSLLYWICLYTTDVKIGVPFNSFSDAFPGYYPGGDEWRLLADTMTHMLYVFEIFRRN